MCHEEFYIGRKRGIPRGVPNVLMEKDNQARKIPLSLFQLPEEAAQAYRSTGTLTVPDSYGLDPLELDSNKKSIQEQAFFPSFDPIFQEVVNNNSTLFRQALLFFYRCYQPVVTFLITQYGSTVYIGISMVYPH